MDYLHPADRQVFLRKTAPFANTGKAGMWKTKNRNLKHIVFVWQTLSTNMFDSWLVMMLQMDVNILQCAYAMCMGLCHWHSPREHA